MQQQVISGSTHFVLPQPEYDVGQRVRIRRGAHRGSAGRITLCAWQPEGGTWGYMVKCDDGEVGALTRHDLF